MLNIPATIKTLLKSDSVFKNFRVHFPNGERADITNDNIITESVELEESICSQKTLTFDKCETPAIEFETIGVENIKGAIIECYLEIECPSTVSGAVQRSDLNNKWVYPISYGTFVVNKCKKQSDMTHRKIEAYNYSTYLGGVNPIERAKKEYLSSIRQDYNVIPYHFLVTNKYIEPDEYTQYSYITNTGNVLGGSLSIKSRTGSGTGSIRLPNLVGVYHIIYDGKQNYKYLWEIQDNKIEYDSIIDTITDKINEWLGNDWYIDESFVTLSDFLKQFSPGIKNGSSLNTLWGEGTIFYYDTYNKYPNNEYIYQISPRYNGFAPSLIFIPTAGTLSVQKNGGSVERYNFTILSDYSQSLKLIDVSDKILMANDTYPVISSISNFQNVSQLIGDYFELQGKSARVNRQGKIDAISVENSLANPVEVLTPTDYDSLWYDDDMTKPFGRIMCSYKNTDGNDAYLNRDLVDDFNEKDYKKYSITNNSLIKANQFTTAQINAIFDMMEENINDISYMPLTLSMIGRPDIEAGDALTITTRNNESIPCLVMKRTLGGVRRLSDGISASEDDEDIRSLQLDDSYDEDTETLTISIVKS